MNYTEYALCAKALGDETRIRIFNMLKNGECCACDILKEFNCTQPTLSYHMKILNECGLTSTKKVGKWSHYSLCATVAKDLAHFIIGPYEKV